MGIIKLRYYVKNVFLDLLPRDLFTRSKKHQSIDNQERVAYYNKLSSSYTLINPTTIDAFQRPNKLKTYYFDLIEILRFFSKTNKFDFKFGDVREVPHQPSFVKSRPIHGENTNSILLKLNKVRHFNLIHDKRQFEEKRNILIGRIQISKNQLNRISFYEKYFNHHLCDLGDIKSTKMPQPWDTPKISIEEHLKYKFVLSLEGNDVATNLKWIMSSNSIAVSPKLKFETWFMEGTLIPDVHFICIKDDYSDLEEKLNYYIANTDKALEIIKNANAFVEQFKNLKNEKAIAYDVVEKYFELQKG